MAKQVPMLIFLSHVVFPSLTDEIQSINKWTYGHYHKNHSPTLKGYATVPGTIT